MNKMRNRFFFTEKTLDAYSKNKGIQTLFVIFNIIFFVCICSFSPVFYYPILLPNVPMHQPASFAALLLDSIMWKLNPSEHRDPSQHFWNNQGFIQIYYLEGRNLCTSNRTGAQKQNGERHTIQYFFSRLIIICFQQISIFRRLREKTHVNISMIQNKMTMSQCNIKNIM